MRFLLQNVWSFLLNISMPWQALLVLLMAVLLLPWLALRFLPWLAVTASLVLTFLMELIVQALCFFECQIAQGIRKSKRNPPGILYFASDILTGSVRVTQAFKAKTSSLLRKTQQISWILRPKAWYSLPLIILPIWFLRPHLGNSGISVLIDGSVSWWCSLEHWAMTGEWKPSNLTCLYPGSSPRWDSSLKPQEYKAKRMLSEHTRRIEEGTNQPDAYYDRAETYLFLEDVESAFDDYTASIEVDSSYAPGYVGRGNIYFSDGDKDAAFKEYSNAISANQEYVPGYVGRGDVYLLMNDHSSAFKEYTAALEINSEYVPAHIGRGDVYQKTGDKDAALKEYTKAIEIDPEFAITYARIGNLYYRNFDNREAAIEEYEKAAELFMSNGQVDLYDDTLSILDELHSYTIYIVSRGDSLSKIAKGHGVSMKTIVSANKETYPALAKNPDDIEVGWKLKIPK